MGVSLWCRCFDRHSLRLYQITDWYKDWPKRLDLSPFIIYLSLSFLSCSINYFFFLSLSLSLSLSLWVCQMTLCVDDFQSLVSLASSMVDGGDPSSSVLLGARNVTEPTTNPLRYHGDEIDCQRELEQVQKLREEVERLRVIITERYADQIANDCNVQ